MMYADSSIIIYNNIIAIKYIKFVNFVCLYE